MPVSRRDYCGVWGYAEFLQAIGDPEDEEYDRMLEWAGELPKQLIELRVIHGMTE